MPLNLSIFALVVFVFFSRPVFALDFQLHDNDSVTLTAILATGTVRWEDAENLDRFLSHQPRKRNTAVYLNSPGGDLGGGIRLGEYFHNNRIKTVVEGHEMCASACALAFLGGTDRYGKRWMSSTTTSQLGFHAFNSSNSAQQFDSDSIQAVVGTILHYGQVVGAPMEIFVRNFQTPSDKIYWFSTKELLSLGIKVWDMENNCFIGSDNC